MGSKQIKEPKHQEKEHKEYKTDGNCFVFPVAIPVLPSLWSHYDVAAVLRANNLGISELSAFVACFITKKNFFVQVLTWV